MVQRHDRVGPVLVQQLVVGAADDGGDRVVHELGKGFIAAEVDALRIFIKNRIGDGVDQRAHGGLFPLGLLGGFFLRGDVLEGRHVHRTLLVLGQEHADLHIDQAAVAAAKAALEVFLLAASFQIDLKLAYLLG